MKKQEEHCMDNESQGQKKNERQNYSTFTRSTIYYKHETQITQQYTSTKIIQHQKKKSIIFYLHC